MANHQSVQEAVHVAVLPTAYNKSTPKIVQKRPYEGLWKLELSTGGRLPKELTGLWKDAKDIDIAVEKAIKRLERRKEGKERWERHSQYFKWKDGKNPWR